MKVWSFSGTKWSFTNNDEWKAVPFKGLADLCEALQTKEYYQIDELVVVAHGDRNGEVDLDPELTWKTVHNQHKDLVRLRQFLNAEATVAFVSCTAGGYERGDELLTNLSGVWAGTLVIGYDVSLIVQGPRPGYEAVLPYVKGSRSDKWSANAKWSKNGSIVKPPIMEVASLQDHDPTFRRRCGSDSCSGHMHTGEMCNPYKRRHYPSWPVSLDEIQRLKKKLEAGHSIGSTGQHPPSGGKPHHMDPKSPAHPSGTGNFKNPSTH